MKPTMLRACAVLSMALAPGCGGSPALEAPDQVPLGGVPPAGSSEPSSAVALLEPSPYTGPDDATDLLQWGAGAFVVRDETPPTSFTSKALVDGLHDTVTIGIPRREPLPHRLVIELPALTTFKTFAIPEIDEFGPARGRHVATVALEGSTESPDAGFRPLCALSIKLDAKAPQHYAVPEPRPIRFLRVTLSERLLPPPADFDPTVFAELIGYGDQEPIAVPPDRYTGRWRFRRAGIHDAPGLNIIELTQTGRSITGCQTVGGKQSPVTGDIVGGIAQLMVEPEGVHGGSPVAATVTTEGALVGARFSQGFLPFWAAPDPQAPAPCEHTPAPADPIVEALRNRRPAIVHGIHFDVDSDALRPEATPALERVLSALRATPEMRVVIEGHTDSDGSDAHNLTLSARRARSVVDWLTAKGLPSARLSADGKGEAEPIADNATLAGKQLNRRVEIEAR